MTDETDITSEVARLAAVMDPEAFEPWEPKSERHQRIRGLQIAGRQAIALRHAKRVAEAGLLRAFDPDAECGVCGGTRDRAEVWRRKANRTDYALAEIMPTLRKIFSDATENERQMLDAVDVLIEQAREGEQEAQIATQEPAGAPGVDSAGHGASGGLGERLRALFTGADPKATHEAVDVGALGRLADEVDVLEAAYRVADAEIARLSEFHDHYRAQVEAIRAAITREAAHGEAITRCNLVAERFQTVLDSMTAP